MKLIVNKALAKNKVVGTFVETVEEAKYWSDLGVAYVSYSVDVGLIFDKFKEIANGFKN